jgi:hypothetical protein
VLSGPAIERLNGVPELIEVVTTNTVPMPLEKRARLKNLTVLSVAAIFGEAMRCNTLGRSVGELFAFWHEDEPPQGQRPDPAECTPPDPAGEPG